MKTKLSNLTGLENITIAAYDIPDNALVASEAKYTKASGKRNCFISGKPDQRIQRDLETLMVSAHRVSCTFAFRMDEAGFEALSTAMKDANNIDENEKKNKPDHLVLYATKRKFTISYFNRKGIATLYASPDLFDASLAQFFTKQWGTDPLLTVSENGKNKKNQKKADQKSEKKKKMTSKPSDSAKFQETKSPEMLMRGATPELTTLPAPQMEAIPLRHPAWTMCDMDFRINRIEVRGEGLTQNAAKKLKKITDSSNNSVSIKIENKGPGKKKQAVTLISNVNTALIESMNCLCAVCSEPVEIELRFPMSLSLWEYASGNNWVEESRTETTKEGFCVRKSDASVIFCRNEKSGICTMAGEDSFLFYNCVARLSSIFENNSVRRPIEKETINTTIRAKIPYTIKALKDQADQFIDLISPSFVLLNDPELILTDYSPMVFSVYRGVELYLKYLADLSGIDLADKPVGKLFKAGMNHQSLEQVNNIRSTDLLQSIFENFSSYRNSLFHANLDNVYIISSRQAAEDICISALQNLETASFQFHLEEMTMMI